MTIQTRILASLEKADGLCDDCLSEIAAVTPRQAINANARVLHSKKLLTRPMETCSRCRRVKIVNRVTAKKAARAVTNADADAVAGHVPSDRRWYWEGNVQEQIARFLVANGYRVDSLADTASREPGKDIVARSEDGRLLWVTVKGFPEKSKNTQARHWFAGALHDLARYRDEDESASLAMGLPRGFKTYESLIRRNGSVRRFLGYRVYWVGADGSVAVDEAG